MNNGLNYSERLEAYLRNELSESERAEFEDMLRQDPLLQNELQLQQDIIASICDYRKNELKQRLNRVDVNNAGRGNTGSFALGSLVVGGIALVGIAGLFYLNESTSEVEATKMAGAAVQSTALSDSGKQEKSAFAPDKQQMNTVAEASQIKKRVITPDVIKTESKGKTKKALVTESQPIQPQVPSDQIGNELLQEQDLTQDHDLVMPESRIAASTDGLDTKLIVLDNSNTSFKLHYKYADGQLYLYGLDKTYNIIDLPNHSQRYLYYDGNYYKLDINQTEIAPMPKVTNLQEIQLADSYNQEMKQD